MRRKVIQRCKLFLLVCGMIIGWYFVRSTRTLDDNHLVPIREKEFYNLMEEGNHIAWNTSMMLNNCNLHYANMYLLPQDHPCVLDLIRRRYLIEPPPPHIPLDLDYPDIKDPSAGQVTAVLRLLRNMTNGFYVECGAANGEGLSNTLLLERDMNWTGLLIEPDPTLFVKLTRRKRKSWTIPACLSLEKYPTEVSFNQEDFLGKIQGAKMSQFELDSGKFFNVQCFPLYSILLAHGRKRIDFFSLDVEGHEFQILKTIPWHKVDITLIVVEWEHVEEGYDAIVDYMTAHGYVTFGKISTPYARDIVFIKDYLRDLQYDDY